MALDDNWPTVAGNLQKKKEELGTSVNNLRKGGVNPRVLGMFYWRWCRQYLFLGHRRG